jgi:hypothetical protein
VTLQTNYFRLIDSVEGEIIFRIHKDTGLLPVSQVLPLKYTADGRFLWRRHYAQIKTEIEEYEKMKRDQPIQQNFPSSQFT